MTLSAPNIYFDILAKNDAHCCSQIVTWELIQLLYDLNAWIFSGFCQKSDFELSKAYESISLIAYPSLNSVSQQNATSVNFRFAEIFKIFQNFRNGHVWYLVNYPGLLEGIRVTNFRIDSNVFIVNKSTNNIIKSQKAKQKI